MKLKIKSYTLMLIYSGLFLIAVAYRIYCFSTIQKETNPLKLPANAPEPLVALTGKLIFKLYPGPPEYSSIEDGDRADYCWILQLDNPSLDLAFITPVAEPANNLEDILDRPNHGEVLLSLNEDTENFCYQHKDRQITVEGYLFHAHTAHHYTPMLMDVKRIL